MRNRLAVGLALCAPLVARAQAPSLSDEVRALVRVEARAVALTNVRVIDGTGAAAREGQTVLLRDGVIAAVGASGVVRPPTDATVLDLAGQTVLPGYVMGRDRLRRREADRVGAGPGRVALAADARPGVRARPSNS